MDARGTSTPTRSSPAPPDRVVFRNIVLLAVAVRAGLWVLGLLAIRSNGVDPLSSAAVDLWARWDAPHFLRIAEVGYRSHGEDALFIVFLPFYPLAVRAVVVVVRDLVLAGLTVSFVASIGAAWFLYRLVRLDAPHPEAWRGVLFLFAFPTAYFLAAPYSEALFLAASLGAMYAVRRGGLLGSGLAGGIATGTRLQALPLLPVLGFEAVRGRRPIAENVRRLAPLALSGVGFVVYLGINAAVHGDPLHFFEVQRSHWQNTAAPPWTPIHGAFGILAQDGTGSGFAFIAWGRLLGTAFTVVVLALGVRRLRAGDQLYGWLTLILILSSSWLISLPRYLLGIYPLYVVLGWLTHNRAALWGLLAAGATGQAALFWRYAQGMWTF